MSPKEVISFAKEHNLKMVNFKFTDMFGTWQQFTIPTSELSETVFAEGLGFDGSSVRGWQGIQESDMLVMPDSKTAKVDPFMQVPTLSLICDIVKPDTNEPYLRDPRQIARRAIEYLRSTGIADTCFVGPEAEFFIFDHVSYDESAGTAYYEIDSEEAIWNKGRGDTQNLGYRPRHKQGYFPALPVDQTHDIRTEMCLELEKLGMQVERQHHEVATAGQGEIDIRFDNLLEMADKMMWFKYVIRNVAHRHNKVATFMPKPVFGDNGSGMHTHLSLWKDNKPLFAGDKYAGLSEMGLHFIGGILKHAPTTCAFTNPTTNSYKRLVPGFEAPVKLAYSYRNRSAAIRIPNSGPNPNAKRIEFRTPDPMANPYLAFAALLMAGIDGVENKIHPGDPMDKDIYGLPPQELANIPAIPATLDQTLDNLESNADFLTKGDVFSSDMIDSYISYKRANEILPIQQRPVPHEFYLYFDM